MRDKIRRLQKAMHGTLEPVPQRDGSTAYVDPQQVLREVFLYFAESARADYKRDLRPAPPACLEVVANAKDRQVALEMVMAGTTHLPVDEEALIVDGEFVPRQLAPSYTPVEGE